jgi:hypothetical protein
MTAHLSLRSEARNLILRLLCHGIYRESFDFAQDKLCRKAPRNDLTRGIALPPYHCERLVRSEAIS